MEGPADDADTTLRFPRLRATDFATLMVLDQLLRGERSDGHSDGRSGTADHLGGRGRGPDAAPDDYRRTASALAATASGIAYLRNLTITGRPVH